MFRLVWALCLAPLLASGTSPCAPITEEKLASLSKYVQRKFRLREHARLTVSEVPEAASGCYRRLRFQATGGFDKSFYLTPDQKFLVEELNDSTVDPIGEEQRRIATLRRDLEKDDGVASLGPSGAPVTLVVFSDFQCPYCNQLAHTLKQITAQEKQVRVLFRHMPLSGHSWARVAAETAACVQIQDAAAFWQLHNYLFEHQREFTPQDVQQRILSYGGSLPGVKAGLLRQCVDEKRESPRIERDLSLARANNVGGTPTVFVNGHAVEGGAPTREHLLTLIRETLNEANRQSGKNGSTTPTR
jgi:protein-disulfide isomerase